MIQQIIMPRTGDTPADCAVEEWKKSAGDTIEVGDIVCLVATEKAVFELESPYEGTLVETLVQINQSVPTGTPIARIEVNEETDS